MIESLQRLEVARDKLISSRSVVYIKLDDSYIAERQAQRSIEP
jgi:hypothetical protein